MTFILAFNAIAVIVFVAGSRLTAHRSFDRDLGRRVRQQMERGTAGPVMDLDAADGDAEIIFRGWSKPTAA